MSRFTTHSIRWFAPLLLHIANRNPAPCKEEFYKLKDSILDQHGKPIGYAVQFIKKQCWECGGTGLYNGFFEPDGSRNWHGSEHNIPPCACGCQPPGVYRQFWVLLRQIEFGGFTFLRPMRRTEDGGTAATWTKMVKSGNGEMIDGYIKHAAVGWNTSREAKMWLALFFRDMDFFWINWNLGSAGKFTVMPLCLVSDIVGTWKAFRILGAKFRHDLKLEWEWLMSGKRISAIDDKSDDLPF